MTAAESKPKSASVRLKVGEKVAYGAGNVAFGIIMFITTTFLLFYYSDALGLSPALAGTALMLGKLWDAINDPLTGYISDHTSSRWGRRRVFLLFAAVPVGALFYFIWAPPSFLTASPGIGLFTYLLVTWILLMSGASITDIPYYALGAEMSSDADERSSIFAYSNAGARIGQLLAVLAGNFVLSEPDMIVGLLHDTLGLMSDATAAQAIVFLSDPTNAFRWAGAVFGLLITAIFLWTFAGTRERVVREQEAPITGGAFRHLATVLKEQYATLKDKPFRILIISTLVGDINAGMMLSTIPFVIEYWLKMQDWFAAIFLIVIVAQIFFGFMWVRVSRSKGKKFVFAAAQLIYGVNAFFMLLMGPGRVAQMLLWALVVSLALAAYLMVWSLIADVVDYDEHKRHIRREGAFYSMYTLTNKVATAIGTFLVGLFLSAIGMQGDFTVTPTMIFWLKMFFGPAIGTLNLVGLAIFMMFPYNREEHQKIQADLEQRKAALPADMKPAGVAGTTSSG